MDLLEKAILLEQGLYCAVLLLQKLVYGIPLLKIVESAEEPKAVSDWREFLLSYPWWKLIIGASGVITC